MTPAVQQADSSRMTGAVLDGLSTTSRAAVARFADVGFATARSGSVDASSCPDGRSRWGCGRPSVGRSGVDISTPGTGHSGWPGHRASVERPSDSRGPPCRRGSDSKWSSSRAPSRATGCVRPFERASRIFVDYTGFCGSIASGSQCSSAWRADYEDWTTRPMRRRIEGLHSLSCERRSALLKLSSFTLR